MGAFYSAEKKAIFSASFSSPGLEQTITTHKRRRPKGRTALKCSFWRLNIASAVSILTSPAVDTSDVGGKKQHLLFLIFFTLLPHMYYTVHTVSEWVISTSFSDIPYIHKPREPCFSRVTQSQNSLLRLSWPVSWRWYCCHSRRRA